jgi:hypothetical protein
VIPHPPPVCYAIFCSFHATTAAKVSTFIAAVKL